VPNARRPCLQVSQIAERRDSVSSLHARPEACQAARSAGVIVATKSLVETSSSDEFSCRDEGGQYLAGTRLISPRACEYGVGVQHRAEDPGVCALEPRGARRRLRTRLVGLLFQ
jgi:hypothetical protein